MSNLTRDVINLIRSWRQTGSTTIMMNGAKNEPCFLLVSDERYGEVIRRKYGIKDKRHLRVIPYRGLYARIHEVDGTNLPMVIDNSFLLSFAEDAGRTIRILEDGRISDKKAIESLEYRLAEFMNHEKYNDLRRRINGLVFKETLSSLAISSLQKTVKSQPYFYVPLTLFLSFYFIMFIYIISNFIF